MLQRILALLTAAVLALTFAFALAEDEGTT